MIAFIIYPEDDKTTGGKFRNWFPRLKEDEALLEGGYTFEKFRGNRLHPSVITDRFRICKDKGFRRVVAYIEKGNIASLKGYERAGFTQFEEIHHLRVLFFTRRKSNNALKNS